MVTVLILAAATIVQQAAILPSKDATISVAPDIARLYPDGTETFKVSVSPDGATFGCVARIEGHGSVNDVANCKKLAGFKAKPAIDQNGQSTYGAAVFVLSWHLFRASDTSGASSTPPRVEPDLYLPLTRLPNGVQNDATSNLVLVAGADGKVETCAVQQTSGVTALDEAACHAVTVAGVAPAKDAAGAAVRAVHSVRVGFSVRP